MKIPELFGRGRPIFSFEFFLPKPPETLDTFVQKVKQLKTLAPDFVTLTYGAGGSARQQTLEAAGRLQSETGMTTACHLTGIAHTRAEISAILDRLTQMGIQNIVALRGDMPKESETAAPSSDFRHAEDLVRFIAQRDLFQIAVAAYPETHPQALSPADDLSRFASKASTGAHWAITQLFFDNECYFDFVRRARAAGVTIPIIPGIMPVTGYAQLKRFVQLCGAKIPPELENRLVRVAADPEAVVREGIEWSTRQCRDLLSAGAPGIHFYTLNRSHSTGEILTRLRRE